MSSMGVLVEEAGPPSTITPRLLRRPIRLLLDANGNVAVAPRKEEYMLEPEDHGEAIAIFRAEVVGALTKLDLGRGELKAELRRLSTQRLRPPGHDKTKTFSVPTLERWYYAYKRGGLLALKPTPRSDRGRAKSLSPKMKDLLLDIRREYPSASVPLILQTLITDGRLDESVVSVATVRRL
jgi:hypothetical protein